MAESKKPIMEEIATTADGKDVTRGYLDPLSIQPVNDSVLTLRGGGDFKIYSEILRDDQVAASFNQRRLAVVGKNWQIEAGGTSRKDKAAADYLRAQLQHIGWDNVTDKMLYGVFYGFGVAEAMYARDGQHIVLDNIKVRNRRRFGYDGLNRLRMRTPAQPMGELLPERKFWSFSCGSDNDDDAYGLGLGHWLYWPAFFKRNGLKYWLLFLEKFGQPTAVGKYNANNTEAPQKQKLLQALQAIATDSGVTIPEGMVIELLEAKRSGTGDYAAFYDKMDAAIAKVVLGQTASTQGTPGRLGNDELQSDVRLDIIKADADLICESFNRSVVKWLVEWNFPGAAAPRVYRKVEPDEDMAKRAERDNKVFGMGYKPSLQYVQENYGDGWEAKEPAPLTLPLPAVPQFAAPDLPIPQQMLEQARATLEPATNAWINQIREMANSATDMEDLRDKLLTAYPDMSLDQYAQALATASAAANLAGRDDVKPGAN